MALLASLFGLNRETAPVTASDRMAVRAFLKDCSIEVMPRTAEKVEDFTALLPKGTRVYIAHIEGTPIEDMVATAKRISGEGFDVMPHFPARIIKDEATLADWIARYQGEAGVDQALLLAGGVAKPHGDYHSSMQLLETGLFDKAGFKRLHVAGHPEGRSGIRCWSSAHHIIVTCKIFSYLLPTYFRFLNRMSAHLKTMDLMFFQILMRIMNIRMSFRHSMIDE